MHFCRIGTISPAVYLNRNGNAPLASSFTEMETHFTLNNDEAVKLKFTIVPILNLKKTSTKSLILTGRGNTPLPFLSG